MNNIQKKKGFTLIELLIVIAIIAILGSATVLVLNPVELMAQSRDGTRLNDLDSLRNAINNYLVNTTTVSMGSCASVACTTAQPGTTYNANFLGLATATTTNFTVSTVTTVAGAGWVPINFGALTGGSPIAALPLDPNNGNSGCLYGFRYEGTNNTFKLSTRLESSKYSTKATNDGGTNTAYYEIGTNMASF